MGGVARALPGCLMWATAAAVAAATETPPPLAQKRAGMPQSPVIAVAPLDDVPTEAIDALLPVLREAFDRDVVLAPGLPLPPAAYDPLRRQYLSTALLDALAGAKRPGWDLLLGVADVDLFVPQLNFVFGEGDPARGLAVFSLARLRPAHAGAGGDTLFRRRASTEAIHELGHAYGLGHCGDPHCVMWFSNTVAESDRKGMRFCRAHARELARAQRR
jgi:archaemetzincin